MKHYRIDKAPVTGVTGTYYTDLDDVRFEIALDTAKQWHEQELPLVMVDASPDERVGGGISCTWCNGSASTAAWYC
ncbi:MAG: hypothetical protein Q4B06_00825 [Candidatus Saccharibacteria bacterium]|nr:hypothetical protein [Candidatus Saccharibacteria bacterium]